MHQQGIKNPETNLADLGIRNAKTEYWNLNPEELMEHAIKKNQAVLSDRGALMVDTGKFTGRAPKDRFIVKDEITEKSVAWNAINQAFSPEKFDVLYQKVTQYFSDREVFIREGYACADENHRLNIRVVAEYPWAALFANNMFLRPSREEFKTFEAEWNVLCAPGCLANPEEDETFHENFAIINFTKKKIIIGGTAYTGEIKKGIFSVLNYILPHDRGVLSMHCSANVGKEGDSAVYFGLSGTGKTTLSADPDRQLIGDDEHGWSEEGVFNFEGGCYAKCIDLSEEKEPDIYRAIKHGAILENIRCFEGTRTPNYEDVSVTQNTRVSYPIYHIDNIRPSSKGPVPSNIFFLTADAFGVLPPISKLTKEQAMYHFISGYTAKVAGTEEGVVEPEATFSACFGAPFLPLHPTVYAKMLGDKMDRHNVNIWLVNTGWTGGPYGIGNRISLKYTRAMVKAALEGALNDVSYQTLDVFGLRIPTSCPNVPAQVLNPKSTWTDGNAYDERCQHLARLFVENFDQYADQADASILSAAPKVMV